MKFDTESIKEERAFLHDVSSPLMVAMGMVDFVTRRLEQNPENGEESEVNTAKLQKAKKALDKMAELLKNRRSLLISRMQDDEGSAHK